MQFKTLIDIVAIDFLNNHNRFEIVYSLLSVRYNLRIFVKIYLNEFFITNTVLIYIFHLIGQNGKYGICLVFFLKV